MSRIALLGLPEDLGNELTRVLLDESHQVSWKRYVSDLRREPNCRAVFISGDEPDYRYTLSLLRESYPDLPVIVATRHPEARFWLDALEAGAADYCGAPFERVQLRWVLGSIVSQQAQPALPAA